MWMFGSHENQHNIAYLSKSNQAILSRLSIIFAILDDIEYQ